MCALGKSDSFSLHLFLQKLTETEIILIHLKSSDFRATRALGYIFIQLFDSVYELSKVM